MDISDCEESQETIDEEKWAIEQFVSYPDICISKKKEKQSFKEKKRFLDNDDECWSDSDNVEDEEEEIAELALEERHGVLLLEEEIEKRELEWQDAYLGGKAQKSKLTFEKQEIHSLKVKAVCMKVVLVLAEAKLEGEMGLGGRYHFYETPKKGTLTSPAPPTGLMLFISVGSKYAEFLIKERSGIDDLLELWEYRIIVKCKWCQTTPCLTTGFEGPDPNVHLSMVRREEPELVCRLYEGRLGSKLWSQYGRCMLFHCDDDHMKDHLMAAAKEWLHDNAMKSRHLKEVPRCVKKYIGEMVGCKYEEMIWTC